MYFIWGISNKKFCIPKDVRDNLLNKILFGACLCIMFFAVDMWNVENVQAAIEYKAIYTDPTWERQERTVGKTTFEFVNNTLYAVKDGKKILLASERNLWSGILTDGTEVYYSVNDITNDSSVIYHVDSIGKKGKRLFSVKKIDGSFCFAGLCDGKIYYIKGIDPGVFCSYSIHSKKKKIIKRNVTTADQFEQYFYLMPYIGGGPTGWLRVYNTKNNNIKIISKKLMSYSVISNHLYYAEIKSIYTGNSGYQYFSIDLKKSNLNGSSKEILIRNLNVQGVLQINKHSLLYFDIDGKRKIKKF